MNYTKITEKGEVIMMRLKELRKAKGLTQEELTEQFNERYGKQYGTSSISMFETGKRIPETQSLIDFADFFGVTLDYLLGRDVTPKMKKTKVPKQLEKILQDEELTYNGEVLTSDDREKIKKALELAFWDAKQKNKRK